MPDNASGKINAFFKQHKIAAWGIVAVGGVSAVVIWRRKAAQQASANPASATTSDTTGQGIDPQTGFPVGSPEDEQALQQAQSGYTSGFGYDPYAGGGFDPFLGAGVGGGSGGGSTGGATGTTAPANNDHWLTEAENRLPNGHSTQVENGLLRVLAGQPVTQAQRVAFLEALAITGEPPEGYPKPIKVTHSAGDQGGSHQKTVVPNEVGKQYAIAVADLGAHGLKAHREGAGKIVQQRPTAGEEVRRGTVVHLFGANK